MNIYQAIITAATQIESHPKDFEFSAIRIPNGSCGSPGCALGWIGHFMGLNPAEHSFSDVSTDVLKLPKTRMKIAPQYDPTTAYAFYERMDELSGDVYRWRFNADDCARTLRQYAAKYHAADKEPLRSDSELVADLMQRVMGERIPEDAAA